VRGMDQDDELRQLEAAAGIADPVERVRVLARLVTRYEGLVRDAARLRRKAIIDALAVPGVTQEQLARSLGVSPGRISQMRKAAAGTAAEPVVTGWLAEAGDQPPARVAICGSRAAGVNAGHVDAAVTALAALLMRRRYAVSHGPTGVGAEVLTLIADQHHPAGLNTVRGIIGHPNVVRDSDYVLVIGGGAGTQAEIDAAASTGKRLLPMPLSGGTAARTYMTMLGDQPLRAWLTDATFSALATADAAQFAELAEAVIEEENPDDQAPLRRAELCHVGGRLHRRRHRPAPVAVQRRRFRPGGR
jgi:hypothetical protein